MVDDSRNMNVFRIQMDPDGSVAQFEGMKVYLYNDSWFKIPPSQSHHSGTVIRAMLLTRRLATTNPYQFSVFQLSFSSPIALVPLRPRTAQPMSSTIMRR